MAPGSRPRSAEEWLKNADSAGAQAGFQTTEAVSIIGPALRRIASRVRSSTISRHPRAIVHDQAFGFGVRGLYF